MDELERNLRTDRSLSDLNVEARGIHGDKQQFERDRIFTAFKRPIKDVFEMRGDKKLIKTNILIATDVASRGLDVRDISIVVNFDLPTNIEDYVHRIGRTGRAGDKGRSFSFLDTSNLSIANDLVKIMKSSGQPVSDELQQLTYQAAHSHHQKKQRYRTKIGDYRVASTSIAYPQKFQRTNNWDNPTRASTQHTSNGNDSRYPSNMDANNSSGASKKRDQKFEDKQSDRYNQQDLKNDLWGG